MLAAFTPTVTLVLLYLFRVETPTLRASVCVLIIGLGCALSSYGEGHFNLVGVAYRSLGILSEATRLVLTQASAPLFMWPLRPHTHTTHVALHSHTMAAKHPVPHVVRPTTHHHHPSPLSLPFGSIF